MNVCMEIEQNRNVGIEIEYNRNVGMEIEYNRNVNNKNDFFISRPFVLSFTTIVLVFSISLSA